MDYYKLAEFEGKRQYFKTIVELSIDVGSKVNGILLSFLFLAGIVRVIFLKERCIIK